MQQQFAIPQKLLQHVKNQLGSLNLQQQLHFLTKIKTQLSSLQRQFSVKHEEIKRSTYQLENKHTDIGKSIEDVRGQDKLVRGKDAKKYGHVLADWKLIIPHESMVVRDSDYEMELKSGDKLTTFSMGLFWLINNVDTFLLDKLCMELTEEELAWIAKTDLVKENPVLQPSLVKQLFDDFAFMVRQEPTNAIFQGYDVVEQVVDLVLRTIASQKMPIQALTSSQQWTWQTLCHITTTIAQRFEMTITTTNNEIRVQKDGKSFKFSNDCVVIPK